MSRNSPHYISIYIVCAKVSRAHSRKIVSSHDEHCAFFPFHAVAAGAQETRRKALPNLAVKAFVHVEINLVKRRDLE